MRCKFHAQHGIFNETGRYKDFFRTSRRIIRPLKGTWVPSIGFIKSPRVHEIDNAITAEIDASAEPREHKGFISWTDMMADTKSPCTVTASSFADALQEDDFLSYDKLFGSLHTKISRSSLRPDPRFILWASTMLLLPTSRAVARILSDPALYRPLNPLSLDLPFPPPLQSPFTIQRRQSQWMSRICTNSCSALGWILWLWKTSYIFLHHAAPDALFPHP